VSNEFLHNHKDFPINPREHIVAKKEYLSVCISQKNISHATLFLGSPASYKEELLEWFIQAIPHEECMRITLDDDSRSLGVEKIRNCKDMLSRTSLGGGRRIVIIENADTLTLEAGNALLKILEEPDEVTHFILTAPNEYQVLATILSRCQRICLYSASQKNPAGTDYAKLTSLLFSQSLWSQLEEGKNITDEDLYALEHIFHDEFSGDQNKNLQIVEFYNRLVELRKRKSHTWVSSYAHDILFLPTSV